MKKKLDSKAELNSIFASMAETAIKLGDTEVYIYEFKAKHFASALNFQTYCHSGFDADNGQGWKTLAMVCSLDETELQRLNPLYLGQLYTAILVLNAVFFRGLQKLTSELTTALAGQESSLL